MPTRVLQIIQWYNNTTHEIAVYEPDYGGETGEQRGRLTQWLEANVRWQTPDGSKPNDHAKDCSILSGVKVIFCDILEVLYCILYITNYLTRPGKICQKRRFILI